LQISQARSTGNKKAAGGGDYGNRNHAAFSLAGDEWID